MSRRKAFTLVELLVVVAILAILAAVLFPVFAQAKTMAKKTQSLSNVKQCTLAAMLYLGDHDDLMFPAAMKGTPDSDLGRQYPSACLGPKAGCTFGYPLLVQSYVKSYDIFYCPNDRAQDSSLGDRFDRSNPIYWYAFGVYPSYGLNAHYMNRRQIGDLGPEWVGEPVAKFKNPATTIMLAEATAKDFTTPDWPVIHSTVGFNQLIPPSGGFRPNGTPDEDRAWDYFLTPGDARAQGQLWGRFNPNLVIVGWLDGHVKMVPIATLRCGGPTAYLMDEYFNGEDHY